MTTPENKSSGLSELIRKTKSGGDALFKIEEKLNPHIIPGLRIEPHWIAAGKHTIMENNKETK